MDFQVKSEQHGEAMHVNVTGEVTIQTSPSLRNVLKPLFDSHSAAIQVNLQGVDFMDSSGIATLVEGLQWSKQSGHSFVLSGLTETVHDVFALAKLDTVFEIEG